MSKSAKPNDGGPAFPTQDVYQTNVGMSLRAWFAGQALPALIQFPRMGGRATGTVNFETIAHDARLFADAMIAELALQEEHDAEAQS